MNKEKKRPTLAQLKSLPPDMWRLEAAQLFVDAEKGGNREVAEEADALLIDPDLTPERVVELWTKYRGAGSTIQPAPLAACG